MKVIDMGYRMRLLQRQDELKKLIDLEREIWGFSEADSDSLLTMKVMSNQELEMGFTFGALLEDELIGGSVFFASRIQGRVYGHLVCLKSPYRNQNIGTNFLLDSLRYLRERSIREVFWTYEPLDAGNSAVYINKLGGKATKYIPEYIEIEDSINGGVPIDRMICEIDLSCLNSLPKEKIDLDYALKTYPLINSGDCFEDARMLLEIPGDYKSLKAASVEEARRVRLNSREVFCEWINQKKYSGERIITGIDNGIRRNFYLLQKANGN